MNCGNTRVVGIDTHNGSTLKVVNTANISVR